MLTLKLKRYIKDPLVVKCADKYAVREYIKEQGCENILIEVDGNISLTNGEKLSKKGADIFVLGTSSLFLKDKTLTQAAEDFRAVL